MVAWRGLAQASGGQHGASRVVEKVVDGIGLRALKQAGGVKHQGLDLFAGLIRYAPAAGHHAGVIGQAQPLGQALVRNSLRAHGLEGRYQCVQQLRGSATTDQYAAFDDGLTAHDARLAARLAGLDASEATVTRNIDAMREPKVELAKPRYESFMRGKLLLGAMVPTNWSFGVERSA